MHACQRRSNRYICVCGKKAVFLQRTTGKYVSNGDHEYCQRCWKSHVSKHRSVLLNLSEVPQYKWQSEKHRMRMWVKEKERLMQEFLLYGYVRVDNDDV